MSFRSLHRTARGPILLALVALLALAGCSSKSSQEKPTFPAVQRGSTLSVTVYDVEKKDAAYYQDSDSAFYVVTPSEPGRKLAAARVTVRNDKATSVLMDVKDGSFFLVDKDGKEYPGVNPFKSRQLAPNLPQTEPLFTPPGFIWGKFDIPKEYGITAWTLFDVPADVTPSQFRWEAVETVYVRFFQ